MAAPAYVLGLDAGRSGLGLVVVAGDGTITATLRRAYSGDSAASTDPQDWWRAARTGIKELLRRAGLRAEQIRAIGVSGDPEAIVALDRTGKVLSECTFGAEPGSHELAAALTARIGTRTLLNLAAGPATPGSAAVKLLRLRDTAKRVWHDLAQVLPAKDFLRYRLTGTQVTDAADAAGTLLFNPRTRTWSKQLLQLLEFPAEWLPTIGNGQAVSGRVTEAAAREAGLAAGTPVVTGAGHAAAAAIASGVLAPGAAVVELGGRGALLAPTAESIRDPSLRLASGCHTLANVWSLTAYEVAGSSGLDWLMANVLPTEVAQARRAQRDPLELLAELASEVPTGADGLVWLSPANRPHGSHASGFLGLDQRHGRGHLARAVLEAGALSVRAAFASLRDLRREPERVVVTGPGSTNHLWCQILADALDRTVAVAPVAECAAVGAAILAASAIGVHKTIDIACDKMVKAKTTLSPRKAAADVYAALAPLHERLPAAIAGPAPAPAPNAASAGEAGA